MKHDKIERMYLLEAAFKTAETYYNGTGIEPNHKIAAQYYRTAAEGGHVRAQYMLGKLYAEGDGVRHIEKVAAHWYLMASLQGDEDAQAALVNLHVYGTSDDLLFYKPTEKVEWFIKEAKNGDSCVQFHLAEMYEEGRLADYDEDQALFWYKESANNDHPIGKFRVAQFLLDSENDNSAMKYLLSAANDGYDQAQFFLACLYDEGEVVPKNQKEAIRWYRKAADQGVIPAQARLAVMLENGFGCRINLEEAEKWYWRAADSEPLSACHVAALYREGKGVIRNDHLAAEWYQKAIHNRCFLGVEHTDYIGPLFFDQEKKVGEAQRELGRMYLTGEGVEKNEKQAHNLFRAAAERGDAEAQYLLAVLLEQGRGTERNLRWAKTWYERAANQGHNFAKNALACMLEDVGS